MKIEETRINPCSILRKDGTKGKRSTSFISQKIYESPDEVIVLRTDRIEEGAWDYGFEVRFGEKSKLERFPGGNFGWFAEEWHAALYGLQAIRIAFKDSISNEALEAIREEIMRVQSPSLF